MFLGLKKIDDALTFVVNTHTPSTGAATDADAVPAYRVYEDETATPILTGNMAKIDDANTTGFYSEQIMLSVANGFEVGKTYSIYISAAVGGITGTVSHSFGVTSFLEQSDILSDATPFAGANINASIGSRSTFDPATTNVTVGDIVVAALARFLTTDTTLDKTNVVAGSVVDIIGQYMFDLLAVITFPSGAIAFTYTLTDSVSLAPIAGADIWISTDAGQTNIVWRGTTDAFGVARDVTNGLPDLDAGTYYFWRQDPTGNYTFTNPDTEVVS